MDELGEGACGGRWSTASQAGKAGKDGVGLLETYVGKVTAVAGVPAERRPPELLRVVDQEQDELEGIGEADVLKLRRCGEGDRRVAGVERAAEAA